MKNNVFNIVKHNLNRYVLYLCKKCSVHPNGITNLLNVFEQIEFISTFPAFKLMCVKIMRINISSFLMVSDC